MKENNTETTCGLEFAFTAIDLETRTEKKNIDKLAPISNIIEMFVKNCQDCYCVEEYLTLDEKLEKFRGRCFFKQYITSKPRKYDNIFVYPMLKCTT